jgi:PAS domain S-box-containing protein
VTVPRDAGPISDVASDEEQRRSDEAPFQLLFAANPLPMWVYDIETMAFLEVNDAAVKHYGYSRAEFLTMRLADIRPAEDVPRLIENVARLGAANDQDVRRDSGTWRHRLKDGRIRDVEIAAQTLAFSGRRGALVVARDVTELQQTQQALRQYAERLAILHEIDTAVIAAETPLAIAEPAIRRLRELLGVPRAIVSLFHLDANEAEWLVAVGRRRAYTQPGMRFSMTYMGDVESMRRGELQTLVTTALPPGPEVDALLGSGVDVYMVVPMLALGELIGGLSFGGAPGAFSAEQIGMAQEVAAQLAIAITHARLHERVKRHADELEQRVHERTVELHAANERLQREIAERRRAQAEADRASRLKSEFLANMSHELRTPLNAILGFTQLIHDGAVAPESPQFTEFLGDILASGHHLLQLINDVLDLAKVEAGKLEFHPETVDLGVLIAELLAIMRTTAAAKSIAIASEVAPDMPALVIDPARLKQILYNYVSNALKFTEPGGRVVVSAKLADDASHFRLDVEDTGIGIAPEDFEHLFIEFQQLDAGVAKKHAGTGLGLSLCKRLAEAQGGTVGVSSVPGKGSTFYAVLPLRADSMIAPLPPPRLPGAYEGSPVVLVVEDNARDRALLVKTLVAAGYAVDEARTGAQALAKCKERAFDAITLDLLLPDASGLDVLSSIRASNRNSDVPVIVVTVVTERGAIGGFAVHDLLPKPLDRAALLESLERARISPRRSGEILVVDDDRASLRLMAAALQQLGYRARCVSNGDDGIRIAETIAPTALVLDLMMPVMDGFQFLERFRDLPACRNVPVLIWTMKDLTGDEYARLQLTVQCIVSKGRGGITKMMDELRTFIAAGPLPAP